jgi:hypothetical protein
MVWQRGSGQAGALAAAVGQRFSVFWHDRSVGFADYFPSSSIQTLRREDVFIKSFLKKCDAHIHITLTLAGFLGFVCSLVFRTEQGVSEKYE